MSTLVRIQRKEWVVPRVRFHLSQSKVLLQSHSGLRKNPHEVHTKLHRPKIKILNVTTFNHSFGYHIPLVHVQANPFL